MRPVYAVALALLLAGAQACRQGPEATMMIAHSTNGLRLSLPESLPLDGVPQRPAVKETTGGFLVTLGEGSIRRVAIEASVALREGATPTGAWPSERDVGVRRIHYRIDRAEGGSGGSQVDFHAWEACAGGHLEYAQGDVVEEPGQPDFSLAWTVIAGTQAP